MASTSSRPILSRRESTVGTEVTSAAVQYGEGETLRWNGHAIRVLPVNGVLWFALPDMCDALRFRAGAAATVDKPRFPAWAKMVCAEDPTDEGKGKPRDVVILSPVGVWYFTCLTDPGRGQNLAAWAKSKAEDRNPTLPHDDRTLALTLEPDGSMPPYPCKFSGWKRAWITLRQSAEYLTGQMAWQRGRSYRQPVPIAVPPLPQGAQEAAERHRKRVAEELRLHVPDGRPLGLKANSPVLHLSAT